MQKILLFGFVFIIGVAAGGMLRYESVEAQFDDIEVVAPVISNTGGNLGQGGGGSCG